MQRDDWLAVLVMLLGAQLALMMVGFELVLRQVEAQGRPLVRVFPGGEADSGDNVSAIGERRTRRQRDSPQDPLVRNRQSIDPSFARESGRDDGRPL